MPLRPDPGIRVLPRIVPGPPQARRDRPEASRRTLDRDAPRPLLAGVRRRRDQPGRWVRPGAEKPTPRPTGPAGGMKRILSPRSTRPARMAECRRTPAMVEPPPWERMSFHHRGRPTRRMDAVY